MYNKIIGGFYLVALTVAILSGVQFGFKGTHTPPIPFLVAISTLSIGLVWLLIDTIRVSRKRTQTWKDIIAHAVGIVINASFVIYLVLPIFR